MIIEDSPDLFCEPFAYRITESQEQILINVALPEKAAPFCALRGARRQGGEKQMTEMQLLEFLKQNHTGETKAVSSRELEAVFEIKGSLVRKLVNSLRCGGQNGYYYAASSSELRITIRQLSSRISKIAGAKNGLLWARARWSDNGQTTLPI